MLVIADAPTNLSIRPAETVPSVTDDTPAVLVVPDNLTSQDENHSIYPAEITPIETDDVPVPVVDVPVVVDSISKLRRRRLLPLEWEGWKALGKKKEDREEDKIEKEENLMMGQWGNTNIVFHGQLRKQSFKEPEEEKEDL